MDKKEELIYNLIFSDKDEFKIDIGEYIDNIYNYEVFISEIRKIIKKSKITVIKSTSSVNSTTVIWYLKIKR